MSDERVYRGYMEGQLKRALADIEIPDSYYEKAETAYNSICNGLQFHMQRPNRSELRPVRPWP